MLVLVLYTAKLLFLNSLLQYLSVKRRQAPQGSKTAKIIRVPPSAHVNLAMHRAFRGQLTVLDDRRSVGLAQLSCLTAVCSAVVSHGNMRTVFYGVALLILEECSIIIVNPKNTLYIFCCVRTN